MPAIVRGSLINSVENSPQPRALLIYLILTFLQIVFLFLMINSYIAQGTTDPSIHFFNFIECFDPINNNNLCSIFIIIHFWRDCVKLHTPGSHKPSLNKRRNWLNDGQGKAIIGLGSDKRSGGIRDGILYCEWRYRICRKKTTSYTHLLSLHRRKASSTSPSSLSW